MRSLVKNSIFVTAAVAMIVSLAQQPAAGQAQAYRAPRLAGTQTPDVNGVWQALNTANWDIRPHAAAASLFPQLLGALGAMPAGQGVVEGGEIPYQPWAAQKQKENFQKRLTRATDRETNETTGDPEAKCYLPGVPRATYMGFPFQIVQTAGLILIKYEYADATRMIHMREKPKAPSDSWMGWSIGRWDRDTLVVDVTNQVDRTWFDRAGNFHSDALHVIERYTPISAHHLMYEATIEDPKVFTRPWKISMPLYRRIEQNAQVMEFKCVEFAEQFMYESFIEPSTN